ncbi:hypothetical protein YC2023_001224 [Brassica napus]
MLANLSHYSSPPGSPNEVPKYPNGFYTSIPKYPKIRNIRSEPERVPERPPLAISIEIYFDN